MGINGVILLYGIWNSVTKRFVYGIKEFNQETAWKKFVNMVPKEIHMKWRYEVRKIPKGWVNPKNVNYRR